mgnify:CR=1 FL=1
MRQGTAGTGRSKGNRRISPLLRTVIFPNGTQAELTEIPVYHMPVIDLSHSSEEEIEAFFRKLREEQSHEIFPVGQWPMFRISFYQLPQNRSRVVFSFDMMLVDRFSIEILVKELHDCYENPELTPEPLLHDYRQYVELLAEERSRKLEQDRAFWERQIPEMPLAPAIALEVGEHSGGRFDTKVKRYSAEFYQKLQDVLYENRILPSVYLLYCYGKCLCRFSGTDALSVSMTVSERSPMQHVFSDVIGDFTKLLLVDLESGGTQPWTEVCRKLQKKIRTYLKHTAFDGLDVMKEIARREQLGGKAAFPVCLYQPSDCRRRELLGFSRRDGVPHQPDTATGSGLPDFRALRRTGGALGLPDRCAAGVVCAEYVPVFSGYHRGHLGESSGIRRNSGVGSGGV